MPLVGTSEAPHITRCQGMLEDLRSTVEKCHQSNESNESNESYERERP